MYRFVHHPDVARIRVVNPLQRGWVAPAIVQPQQRPPMQAYTPRTVPMAGCPGQIRCADGRCVDSVTECDLKLLAPTGYPQHPGVAPAFRSMYRFY